MPVWGLWKMISFTSMRKERILRCWGIILPVALLIYIMLCRFLPGCARGYADYVYPNVSFVLSAVSSVIPVSWEEIMAVVVVSLMIFIPVMARRRGEGWLVIFRRLTLLVLWIIIWFYMAWGLNYFRPSLYARCNLRPVEYEEEVFMKFLDVYTEGLNASFTHDTGIEKEEVETIVKRNYAGLSSCYGLARPQPWQHIKLQSRDKGGIADIQLIRRYAFHLQRLTAYCVLKMYVHFAQKMSRINANVVQ